MVANYLAKTLNALLQTNRLKPAKGLLAFLKLWFNAFALSNAPVNITVQRLVIPVLVASIFRKQKVLLIWHHYDAAQKHSFFYHANVWLVIKILQLGMHNLKVVVVAHFWQQWFINKGIAKDSIILIPNLFDVKLYQPYNTATKNSKLIYCGQFGVKQPLEMEGFTAQLHAKGYTCFYTTPNENEVQKLPHAQVLSLSKHDYLAKVSQAAYTVCFSNINEGWNRVAHESLLVGTPVIGNAAGGLGDLLKIAEQPLVSNLNHAQEIILSNKQVAIPHQFLANYDMAQIAYYASPLIAFCNK